jgi:hypothetical protein
VALRALPLRVLSGLWVDVTAAPSGAVVRLYYDAGPHVAVDVGDAIVSRTTGRAYIVEHSRLQTRGLHAGERWHVLARVVGHESDLPADVVRHVLHWYPRRRTRRAVRRRA